MFTTLGARLKQLVKEAGKEQKKVAAELGMLSPTFNGYVGNKREPSVEKLKHFAAYFGVSVDYLTGFSEIRNPYLNHLTEDLKAFVNDPENSYYIELARDVKNRSIAITERKLKDKVM